jgi:CelD/BcsL family acetyltransferase involved in cellulose biosynthesis
MPNSLSTFAENNVQPEDVICPETIQVSITEQVDIKSLESEWIRLELLSDTPFFLSWGWVSSWLRTLPDSIKPFLLKAKHNGETVGLTILTRNTRSGKYLFLPSKVLQINETGDPLYDLLTIEYNQFLISKDHQSAVLSACIDYLINQLDTWDEILISAPKADSTLENPDFMQNFGLTPKIVREQPSWYIDLHQIRESGKDYLGNLSSNTRYQIRRAIRECEKTGPLEITIAASAAEALDFLSCLADYHQSYWISKGQEGCFSNPFFTKFHNELIRQRFSHQEIQLVRIRLGENDLGYLYNLVLNEQVFFYQSGLNYKLGEKLKPGLVGQVMAIEHNLKKGMSIYNFLASDDRYKRSLSTNSDRLLWISLQKNKLKLRLENNCNTFSSSCKKLAKQAVNYYKNSKK